ncbi:MAG: phage antirepressor N-terminal domain-containing protein [Bacteroidota bacterium]
MSDIIKVPFHDTQITCVRDKDTFHTVIRPICDYIGVHGESQVTRIKKDPILGRVHGLHRVHDATNRLQNMVTLPNHYVHGWLFSIQANKIQNPEVRNRLILFQMDCYDVLFRHFTGTDKKVVRNTREILRLTAIKSELQGQLRQVKKQIKKLQEENADQLDLFDCDMPTIISNN